MNSTFFRKALSLYFLMVAGFVFLLDNGSNARSAKSRRLPVWFSTLFIVFLILSNIAVAQEDIADVPNQKLFVSGDSSKCYFLIGADVGKPVPENGFGLVVIMPGGDGSSSFNPFVRRIYKNALPKDYLAAQPVAVKWTPNQEIIWPTKKNKVPRQKFSTEEFVEDVISDVKSKYQLNEKNIFTLSWSSSGPAAYAISLQQKTSVTASFIAMSVFKPEQLDSLDNAKSHAYFIYHSPDDKTCPFRMAQDANNVLKKKGAKVKLVTYQGGHGWHGNVFGDIKGGIQWLEKSASLNEAETEKSEDNSSKNAALKFRRLPVKEYRDKMKAGWLGQMAGVAWGAPTEFQFADRIIPEANMPRWSAGMINSAFGQDDLYVEMTFLRSMEEFGLDVSIRQAGIDFANTGYPLWCANNAGRTNLRKGIAPPDSGHPKFNSRANDIDYQIEADYSGLIAPGLPNAAIALGEKFGRLMNYGDGVYGGQFIGGMYAEAFFEKDPVKIIEAGLKCIPKDCQYAEMVRDMLAWHRQNPDDWQKTWQIAQKKYRENPEFQKASNGGIDVKINGAYVLMGLLYGKGAPNQTIIISCRCGQDSDCNPSSSAGVLFTSIGFSRLPSILTQSLNDQTIFSHTAYNFPALLDVCEKLARQEILKSGGRIEKDSDGAEIFVIPVIEPKPSPLQLTWSPGPVSNSRFTPEELSQITQKNP